MRNLRCLWDNVLVQVDRGGREETTAAGIIKPATVKPGHRRQGEIVAIGPGKPMFHGGTWVTRPMSVKVGQQITFEIGAGTVYPDSDGKEYIVLVEEQITGVFPTAEEIRAEQRQRDIEFAITAHQQKELAKSADLRAMELAFAVDAGRATSYETFAFAMQTHRELRALVSKGPDNEMVYWLPEHDAAVREILANARAQVNA